MARYRVLTAHEDLIDREMMVSDILSDRRDHLFRGQIALVGLVAAEAEVVVGRDEQRLTDVDHGDHADALDRRRRADRRFPRHGHAHRAALARNARKRRAARRDHQIICVQIDRKITRLAADTAGRNSNIYPGLSRAAHGVSRGLRDFVLRRERRAVEIERDQFDFIHMPFPFFCMRRVLPAGQTAASAGLCVRPDDIFPYYIRIPQRSINCKSCGARNRRLCKKWSIF